jgi:hypothetical protein
MTKNTPYLSQSQFYLIECQRDKRAGTRCNPSADLSDTVLQYKTVRGQKQIIEFNFNIYKFIKVKAPELISEDNKNQFFSSLQLSLSINKFYLLS